MRRILITAALIALAAASARVPAASAQSDGDTFIQIDYMKVPADAVDAYLELERTLYKPIHEERMRRGVILGWGLFRVHLAPPEADYNFATVNVFADLSEMAAAPPQDVMAAVHPGMDADAMNARTFAAREIVHTEVWRRLETEHPAGVRGPRGRYQVLNYMSVPAGREDEYILTEREVWKSLHRTRIDAGMMRAWALYELVLPAGTAMHYNYGAVDYYDELGDVTEAIGDDIFRRAHPTATDADIDAMVERTNQARSIYQSVLWEQLDAVGYLGQ